MSFFLPPYSKKHIIIFGSTLLVLLLGIVSLYNSNLATPSFTVTATTGEEIKEDFKAPLAKAQADRATVAWSQDNFLILDIRAKDVYSAKHIQGSLSAPLAQLKYAALDPETDLVIYSTSDEDITKATAIVKDLGVKHVFTLNDSLDELSKQGYKLASTTVEAQ